MGSSLGLNPPPRGSGPYTALTVQWDNKNAGSFFVLLGIRAQVTVIPDNPSKFSKGKPFYLQGIPSKTIKGVQIHSDVT